MLVEAHDTPNTYIKEFTHRNFMFFMLLSGGKEAPIPFKSLILLHKKKTYQIVSATTNFLQQNEKKESMRSY